MSVRSITRLKLFPTHSSQITVTHSAMVRFGLLACAFLVSATRAQEAKQADIVNVLEQRGLSQLAEYAHRRDLTRPEVAPGERASSAIRIAHLLAGRAGQASTIEARNKLWQEAHQVVDQALNSLNDDDSRMTLLSEKTFLSLIEITWQVQHERLFGRTDGPPTNSPQRIARLKEISTLFSELKQRLEGVPRQRRSKQAMELLNATNIRLAFAELTLGDILFPDPLAREPNARGVNALSPIIAKSEKLDHELLEHLMRGYRQLNEFVSGAKLLEQLAQKHRSVADSNAIIAEQIEMQLAQNNLREALRLLLIADPKNDPATGRLKYLSMRTMFEQAKLMANDKDSAAKLQSSAFRKLRALEQNPADAVWAKKADLLIAQFANTMISADARNNKSTGDVLLRSGRFVEAGEQFAKSAEQVAKAGQSRDAVELLFEAGRAFERGQDHARAAELWTKVANEYPNDPKTEEAHWRAINAHYRQFRKLRTGDEQAKLKSAVDAIQQLAGKFRQRFPASDSLVDLLFIEAELHDHAGRFAEAIDRLTGIASTHPQRALADLHATRIYEHWLKPINEQHGGDDKLFSTAVERLQQLRKQLDDKPGLLTSEQSNEVTLRLARFQLDHRLLDPLTARTSLMRMLRQATLSHDLLFSARQLMLIADILARDENSAREMAQQLHNASPPQRLQSARLLEHVARNMPVLERRSIGLAQQTILEGIKPESVAEQSRELVLLESARDLNLGMPKDLMSAITRLEKLKQDRPRDVGVRKQLAFAFMRAGKYPAAATEWRQIIAGVKPPSPNWYLAKYQLVICLRESNQPQTALNQIKLLEVLHPDLGGPTLKADFLVEKQKLEKLVREQAKSKS